MSKISKRIITLFLAAIMTLSGLSGAFPAAFAEDEVNDGAASVEESAAELAEKPTGNPAEEPTEEPEPVEEPNTETDGFESEQEPEEESERPLDLSLIVSDEAELCLKTRESVVDAGSYPAIRLWNSEESLHNVSFAEEHYGEKIVLACAVYDALSEETGIAFTQSTKVYVSGGAIGAGEYALYLYEGDELRPVNTERDGDAILFETEELSLFVLTEEIGDSESEEEHKAEEEPASEPIVHDDLIEVEASDDEPLLQTDELSDETLALLGIERKAENTGAATAKKGGELTWRKGDAAYPAEGDDGEENEETDGEEEEPGLPWASETVTIETLTIEWKAVTHNQWVDPIHRDLVCDTDYVPDQKFQIDISLNGDEIIQPGALELIFPAYLWKTRDGEEAGRLYLSVPAEPDHDAEFAWRRAGDSIIITNTHKMTSTSRILIQAAFRNVKAHDMRDGTDSRTFNDFFNVQANLTNSEGKTLTRIGNQHFKENGEPETKTVPVLDENGEQVCDEEGEPVTREEYVYTPIYATIDTHAAAKVLTKNALNPYIQNEYYTYFTVPAELPAEYLPENPEKYAYARWTIRAIASGSQPYTMTLTDTVGSKYGDVILCADGLNKDVYGVETKGPDEGTNGKQITITLVEGYTTNARSVVIWTAYPKSTMREGVPYYVENKAKLTVIGQDDEWDGIMEHADFEGRGEMFREGVDYTETTDEYGDSRRKPALVKEIEVSAQARIQLPITYRITKQWDDNDDAKGHRPAYQYIVIYRDGYIWREFYLREFDNAAEEDPNNPGQYIHTWTYEWDDGGQPHVYDVEEKYLSSGDEHKDYYVGDEGHDPGEPDDYREYYRWYYVQAGKRYDSAAHTWTFTNRYQEMSYRVVRYPFVWRRYSLSVSKQQYTYLYSDKTNSYDRLLNLLRRGESVIVPYYLNTYAEIFELTYDGADTAEEWKKFENYGKRDARAELEEGSMYLKDLVNFPQYDRALSPGEYDIQSVDLSGFTVYEWRQQYMLDEDGNYVPDPFVEWNYHSNYELTAETELQVLGCSYENGAWGEWKVYATMLNGVITPAEEGVMVSGRRVIFPAGVHKVKTRVDSKAGEVYMSFTANIRVYPAESLKPFIEEAFEHNYAETYAMVSIRNIGTSRIMHPEDVSPTVERGCEATAYLHGRNFRTAASLDKEYVFSEEDGTYFEYDVTKQEFIFTNRVNLVLQSTVLESDLFREFVEDGTLPNTKGGTFYDLLPEGVQPVLESIRVGVYSDNPNIWYTNGTSEDKVLDAYTIENFRGSGKTLLVVKVEFNDHFSFATEEQTENNRSMDPAHYPRNGWRNTHTLFYKSKCVSSEAESRAVNGMIPLFTNTVAFEADEETIASLMGWQGEPDDPTADNNLRSRAELTVGDKNYAGIMTDLDPNRDSNNFVYASASVDLTAAVIQATFYGRKETSSDGIKWSTGELNDVSTYEGTTYSYRLRMEIEAGGAAGNIIFYDPVDVYRYQPGSTKYDGKGYWSGSLLSVDATQLQSLGIAPVVYYYYGEGAVPSSLDDLLDVGTSTLWEREGWTSDPGDFGGDMSRVKAVAVDARHDVNGEEYIAKGWEEIVDEFGETQIVNGRRELVVYLHMRAPLGEEAFENSEDRFDPDENAHAYNVNYIFAQIKKGQQAGLARWNATNVTKVGIIPYKIEVEKVWDDLNDNDRVRPEEIELELYGNGEYVETITVRADEEGKWHGTFMHVQRFDDEYNPIEYSIVEKPIEGYNDSESFPVAKIERLAFDESKQSFKITNHHDRIQTSIPFEKRWDLSLGGDDSKDRPQTITVDLYRWVETTVTDEETGEERTAGDWEFTGSRKIVRPDADGNWKGSFENVWKYEDGREIVYTVRETPVYKYITEYDESELNRPVIANTYYPFGDLLITKEVEHATAAALEKGVFSFDLVLKYNGEEVVELYNYEKTLADGTTETGRILGISSFTLRAGESLLIKDIRSETDYEIVEHPSGGYSLIRKSGDTGTISAGETKSALFVNRYESSAFVALNVTKELTGRALAGYQFKFEIKDADGNSLGIAYNAASPNATTAGGSAPVTLQNLNYTSEDDGKTYYYTVNEVKPENAPDYYVYDERIFGVSVSLTDNGDGTMTSEVKYLGKVDEGADLEAVAATVAESAEPPVFRNEYHAYGETELKAWKTLRGGNLADYKDKFEFEVLQSDGAPLLKNGEPVVGHTDEYGSVTFPTLEYSETDVGETYLYVIKERDTGDKRIVYDDSVLGMTVQILDVGNGTLRFIRKNVAVKLNEENGKWELDGDREAPEPVFKNGLNPGSLAVSKKISWADGITDEETITALQSQEFTFKVKFFGDELPQSVVPEEYINGLTVGDEASGATYRTLREAFRDAADGDTIILLSDIDVYGDSLSGNRTVTINLNGFTVYDGSSFGWAITASDGATLIIDGGNFDFSRCNVYYLFGPFNNGTVIVNGGYYYSNYSWSNIYSNPGIIINGGHFDGNIGCRYFCVDNRTVDALNIYGGTFIVDSEIFIKTQNGGQIGRTVRGGSFTENPRRYVPDGYKVVVTQHDSTTIPNYTGTVYTVVPDTGAGGGSAPTRAPARPTNGEENVSTSQDGAVSVKFEDGTLTVYPADGSEGSVTAQELRGMIEAYASTASSVFVEATVKVTGETDGDYTNGLFAQFSAMASADFSGLDIGDMTSLCGFFYGCSGIKSFDMTGWDFSGADDMSYMFMGCSSATSILLKFTSSDYRAYPDTVAYMFNGCSKLRTLDLSALFFNDESTDTDGFTDGCTKLSSLTYPNDWGVYFGRGFYLPGNEWRHVESGYIVATEDFVRNYYDGSKRYGTWVLNGNEYTIEFEAEESGAVLLLTSETCPVDEDSSPLPMAYLSNHKLTGWTDGENTYAPGAVIPAYTYEAGEAVTLTAVFEENENAGEWESDYYFTLRGGEAKIFNNLPASVHYEVYELTPAGWSLVASSGTSGTIAPLTTSKAAFANKFDPGLASAQITGRKLLDGKPSSVPFSFTIERIEAPEGAAEYETKTVQSNSSGAIDFGTVSYTVEGKYVYKITENAPENYSHDSHEELVTVNVVVSGVYLTATVEYDEDGAVFSNYTKPAEITVMKAITDDEATQNNAEGREFTFRITLTDSFERPLTGGYAKNADGELVPYVELNGERTEIMDGTAVITLKAGESATVGNVPEKTNYLVEETSLPTGWRTVGSGTATGRTAANGSYSVTITNTYVPGSRGQTFASLYAYKELVGDTLQKDMFSFTLRQVSGPGYESFVPETVKNSALVSDEDSEYYNQYAVIRFSDITYVVPGVYVYEATENAEENEEVEYDGHVLTFTVTVTDDGEGRLSSEVESEGKLVFTNRMKTGTLRVEKSLENATEATAEREFTFTLSFFDRAGVELRDEYAVRVFGADGGLAKEESVQSGGSVRIKGGESFTVLGLPHMSTYVVTEEESAGFVRTRVNGERADDSERKAEGTITAGAEASAKYTNVYATVGSANPAVTKVLKGGSLTGNRFKFELRLEDGTVVETAYATPDGSINFAALDFTAEDDGKTLEYWVYEIDTGENDVIYDYEPIKITVEVHDNGMGEMASEVTYDDEREGVFTNYSAVDLTVTKKVRGSVAAEEFSYTVEFTDAEGAAYDPGYVPDSWTRTEAGKYTFTLADGESESVKLPYGTVYRISEAEGEYFRTFEVISDKGTTHEYGNGGVIERTIGDHGGEDVIYYNSAFVLEIEKELLGSNGDDLNFEFSASFSLGGEPYELAAVPEGWTGTGNGTYSFTLRSGENCELLLPYGVKYAVSEIDPDDRYVKTCIISTDDEEEEVDGGTAERTIGDSGNEKLSFKNFRMQELTISKRVYGDDKDEIFTYEIGFKYNGEPYYPEVPENWTKLADGKYSFKLKDGRSVSVKLPYGATYEISEAADERFTAKVYLGENETPIGTDGRVRERELKNDDEIKFVNCETVTVTVAKTVKGDLSSQTKQFTFRLKLSEDGEAKDLAELPDGFERIAAGEYEFKLAHGESVSFSLLGGMRYEISEIDGVKYETRYRIGEGEWTDGRTAVNERAGTTETVQFENTYDSHIPTGISLGLSGAALMAVSLIGAGAVLLKKKEEK